MWWVALWFWISIMSQVQIRNRIVKIVLKLCTWIVHDWNSTSLEARKVTKLVLDDEIFNLKTLKFLRVQNHSFLLEIFQNDFRLMIPTDFGTSLSVSASKFEIQTSPYPFYSAWMVWGQFYEIAVGRAATQNIGKISMIVVSWSH